jgi:hypothetical protein
VFAVLFERGIPWEPEERHEHRPLEVEAEPAGRLAAGAEPARHHLHRDARTHAEIHDQLHERRRRAG